MLTLRTLLDLLNLLNLLTLAGDCIYVVPTSGSFDNYQRMRTDWEQLRAQTMSRHSRSRMNTGTRGNDELSVRCARLMP
jgi:hypothetical protein